ncbi:MAG: hypothetical protein IT204_11655 [Fimbriimonadaceae bacterium]|nr:hypothetical protein [Fimbriimonadaceae bacterium]
MPLHAGTAEVAITPPLGTDLQGYLTPRAAERVHDDLRAKALVLDDGQQRVALVVCDLIAVTAALTEPVRARVAAEAGVPPAGLLVSATHTHFGPSTMNIAATDPAAGYLAELPQRIGDAVVLAAQRLRPAQLGVAVGACPSEVFNRRYHLTDGRVVFNPGYQSPLIDRVAGPTDPTFTLLAVRSAEGEPLAAFANLALHYVGAPALDITADYFGAFAGALQRCAGAPLTVLLSNGCQGDLNNCNFGRPAPRRRHAYHAIERVANVAAGEAWKLWNTLWEEDFRDDLTLAAATATVTVQPRRPSAAQVAAARDYLARPAAEQETWPAVYAREHLAMAEPSWPQEIPFLLQALRLGEVGLCGIPAEPFCEIGLALRERSPLQPVVPVGLANDMVGYLPTARHYELGGYETDLCRWAYAPRGTAEAWVDQLVALLGQVAV